MVEVKTGDVGPRQVRMKRPNHAFQALFPPGALLRSKALVAVVRAGACEGRVAQGRFRTARDRIQVQFHRDAADKEGYTHLRSRPDFQIVGTLHMSWRIW